LADLTRGHEALLQRLKKNLEIVLIEKIFEFSATPGGKQMSNASTRWMTGR
jgi:hypothetical protein